MKSCIFYYGVFLAIALTLETEAIDNVPSKDQSAQLSNESSNNKSELLMLNILFRNGDNTPSTFRGNTYPKDPNINNTLFPFGPGVLTNEGKNKSFIFGKYLRDKYSTFLGTTYLAQDLTATSTALVSAKMTLQLVLAGLYPPDQYQTWNPSLAWQPIPTNYEKIEKDSLLAPIQCPRFLELLREIVKLPDVQKKLTELNKTWGKLGQFSRKWKTNPKYALQLYNTLIGQRALNLTIPKWAEETLANHELKKSVEFYFHLQNYNTTIKKFNGGALLRKMLDDMDNARNGKMRIAKKTNLYSGHDYNVAALLLALGVTEAHVPNFTSAVILELHREGSNHFVKVLYYKGADKSEIETMTIPNCSSDKCPFDEFRNLMKNVTPTDEELQLCSLKFKPL